MFLSKWMLALLGNSMLCTAIVPKLRKLKLFFFGMSAKYVQCGNVDWSTAFTHTP
jgi:hypothetical protein